MKFRLFVRSLSSNMEESNKKRDNLNERKWRYLNLAKEKFIRYAERNYYYHFSIFYFIIEKERKYYVWRKRRDFANANFSLPNRRHRVSVV